MTIFADFHMILETKPDFENTFDKNPPRTPI